MWFEEFFARAQIRAYAFVMDSKDLRARDEITAELPLEHVVSAHPFLQGMTQHQIRILAGSAMRTPFKAGELVFSEGDPANRFYLLLSGRVALESYVHECGNKIIETIGAGEVLGWSWLFPPYFWHFSARALEPTDAIFINGTPLRAECEADHDLGYQLVSRLAAVMVRRLQAARRQLLALPGIPIYPTSPSEIGNDKSWTEAA